jgi:IclR family acetate operon transcriptional repressor
MSATPASDPVERVVGIDRVLVVLTELARHPAGIGLEELSRIVASPKPTVHRALRSLRRAGFAAQDGRGHYVLGDELLRLAFAHHEARPDHVRIQPVLDVLANRFHETAHYAVLDGRSVVYRSKVDPSFGAVKLTSVVGGRNPAHATAVGKALLAHRLHTLTEVKDWIGDEPLERRTPNTIVTGTALHRELGQIREHGYSTDDQENEMGINCLAVPVYLTSAIAPSGAVSVSALTYRTPLADLVVALPKIRQIVDTKAEALTG